MKAIEILGPDGELSRLFAKWEARPQQLEMAELVERCIAECKAAMIEAGTGTGKSLAYLVPAIASGHTTIVSTANKTLQAQLMTKDLPLLKRVFPDLTYAVAKGKGNYLCRDKVMFCDAKGLLNGIGADLVDWAQQTDTGDIEEAPIAPTPNERELLLAGDDCLGKECPDYDDCFYYQAKRRCEMADVIVTNHALLCQHLAQPQARMLPQAPVVVVDEAHQLESYAVGAQSVEVSTFSFRGLRLDPPTLGAQWLQRLAQGHNEDDALIEPLLPIAEGEQLAAAIRSAKDALGAKMDAKPGRTEAQAQAAQRKRENLAANVELLSRPTLPGMVRHIVRKRDRQGGTYLAAQATQFDVSALLRGLGALAHTVIYTSATLTTGAGDFAHFARRNGAPADALTLQVESPFDYQTQCLLYLPITDGMPKPDWQHRDEYDRAARKQMLKLVQASDGGALILCTSHYAMQEAANFLRAQCGQPVATQNDGSKAGMIRWLKETPRAVLVATASFWEGVDVPGEALRLVIIDKIPFAQPTPVERARQAQLGKRAFNDLSIPDATLALKQGFGRLIRTRDDWGVVAILDPRLWVEAYGRRILAALPDAQIVTTVGEVERFYAEREEHITVPFVA